MNAVTPLHPLHPVNERRLFFQVSGYTGRIHLWQQLGEEARRTRCAASFDFSDLLVAVVDTWVRVASPSPPGAGKLAEGEGGGDDGRGVSGGGGTLEDGGGGGGCGGGSQGGRRVGSGKAKTSLSYSGWHSQESDGGEVLGDSSTLFDQWNSPITPDDGGASNTGAIGEVGRKRMRPIVPPATPQRGRWRYVLRTLPASGASGASTCNQSEDGEEKKEETGQNTKASNNGKGREKGKAGTSDRDSINNGGAAANALNTSNASYAQLEEDLAVSELRGALKELPSLLREEPQSLCDAMDFAAEYVEEN